MDILKDVAESSGFVGIQAKTQCTPIETEEEKNINQLGAGAKVNSSTEDDTGLKSSTSAKAAIGGGRV